MSISNWLDNVRIDDDPLGDLMSEMQRNRHTLPSVFKNLNTVRAYLANHGMEGKDYLAPFVWRRYRRWQDAHPWD